MNIFSLKGSRALITGSGRGLGLRMARGLAEAGAEVVINDRDRERAEAAAKAIRSDGYSAHVAVFDVTQPAAVRDAVASLEKSVGPVGILINNAGIHRYGALLDLEFSKWEEVLDVNLSGAFLTAQAVGRGMVERQSGKIINICSLMSEVGRPTTGAYMAAKGGLKMLTRAMTVEWACHNIQANGIAPGYILTDMTQHLAAQPEFDGWVKKRTPAARWGTPDDLVGATVFLASPASDFVNGHILFVDGGLMASL
jgi:gluconate 5-dehydrogenase